MRREPVEDIKRVLNVITVIVAVSILLFMVLETFTLIYAAPMVSKSIMTAELGTESDIILPDSYGDISDITIEPSIPGNWTTIADHYIFVPEHSLTEGSKYVIKYKGKGNIEEGSLNVLVRDDAFKPTYIQSSSPVVIISFNKPVVHEDAEALIHFSPSTPYYTSWYGNTLVINTTSVILDFRVFKMKGNVSLEDGTVQKIDVEGFLSYGFSSSTDAQTQIPHLHKTVVYIMLPPGVIAGINSIEGSSFRSYFLFIFISILTSIGYGVYRDHRNLVHTIKNDLRRNTLTISSRSMFMEISLLLMATLFFTMLSYFIVELLNQKPTVPSFGEEPLWFNMYALARAGVWEELVTRIPFIGLPLFLIHYGFKKNNRAPVWRYVFGGNFELDMPALAFLFMSAFFFGLAHALAGWDLFKVLPAMVGGLAMGYLFLKWGLHAAIIMHFANDYLSMPSEMFPSLGMDILTGSLIIVMIIVGAYVFFLYSMKFYTTFISPPRKKASDAGAFQGKGYLYGPPEERQRAQSGQYEETYNGFYGPRHARRPVYPTYAGNSEIYTAPSGYIVFKGGKNGLPYAPYPFRCRWCGGITAVFKPDGRVICAVCGAEYQIKPEESSGTMEDSSVPEQKNETVLENTAGSDAQSVMHEESEHKAEEATEGGEGSSDKEENLPAESPDNAGNNEEIGEKES